MGAVYRDVYDDVVRCAQRRRERDAILQRLRVAQGRLATQTLQLAGVDKELSARERAVRKLQGWTVRAATAWVGGTHGTQLNARQRHAVATRARRDARRRTLASVQEGVTEIREQLTRYEGIDEEYRRVFLDKARELVTRAGPTGACVAKLSAQLVDARAHARELDRAIAAGRATLRSLVLAHHALTSDDPLNDPLNDPADPRSSTSRDAKRYLADTQTWALKFARELAELQQWSTHAEAMAAIARALLHYVDELLRNAIAAWSRGRTRASMDGLRGYVEVQLRRLHATRATVVATHDATELRYMQVVALG